MYIIVEGEGKEHENQNISVKDPNADDNPIENAQEIYTGVIDYETKRRLKNEAKAQVKKKFIIGRTYYLKGRGNVKKEYILKKYIYTINESIVNIVIMKQISGPKASIYTLNPYDCKRYHIKYEDGLQVFSMEMNWILKRTTKTPRVTNGNNKKQKNKA
jgi:hypothetical protein